jgi:hypothetical protein
VAVKFHLFTTDKGSSITPATLNPAPTTLIDLGEDPIFGDYDPNAGAKGRGSRIATFGGVVDQDFGVNAKDAKIRLAVQDSPLAAATIAAIESACATVDGEYYFSDSVNCWKVRFARPDGFRSWRNLFWKANSKDSFSYELMLNIVSKDI